MQKKELNSNILKMSLLALWSIFALLIGLLLPTEAKIVHGYLRTGNNWSFISRFCFLSIHGQFQYEIQYQEEFEVWLDHENVWYFDNYLIQIFLTGAKH